MPLVLVTFADDVQHRADPASTGLPRPSLLFHAVPSESSTAIRAASLRLSPSPTDGSAAHHRTPQQADV